MCTLCFCFRKLAAGNCSIRLKGPSPHPKNAFQKKIQPGFEPGSSECRSDAPTEPHGALALEQRMDGVYP